MKTIFNNYTRKFVGYTICLGAITLGGVATYVFIDACKLILSTYQDQATFNLVIPLLPFILFSFTFAIIASVLVGGLGVYMIPRKPEKGRVNLVSRRIERFSTSDIPRCKTSIWR